MAGKKEYRIQVGPRRPEKMMTGTLDKTTSRPSGETGEVSIPVGVYLVLNVSTVWGRRVINGRRSKDVVSVTDKEYNGEIEFLDWGAANGYRLQIRHLRTSPNSLDLQYQKEVLKLKPSEDEAHIMLAQGVNTFDPATDELMIEFLQHHFRNQDGKSTPPDLIGFDFVEVTAEREDKSASKAIEAKGQAVLFIHEFSAKPESLKLIVEALAGNMEVYNIDEHSTDLEVYTSLMKFADSNPTGLLNAVAEFRKVVSAELSKAVVFSKLDLTKDKVVAFVNAAGAKEILLKDIPQKSDGLMGYIIKNIFESEVNEAYKTIAAEVGSL